MEIIHLPWPTAKQQSGAYAHCVSVQSAEHQDACRILGISGPTLVTRLAAVNQTWITAPKGAPPFAPVAAWVPMVYEKMRLATRDPQSLLFTEEELEILRTGRLIRSASTPFFSMNWHWCEAR